MNERSWGLPGPSDWVRRAVARLSSGFVLLEVPATRSAGLVSAFERVAVEAGYAASGFVRLAGAHLELPPASAILEASLPPDLRPKAPSPAEIAANPDMDGMVVWMDGLKDVEDRDFWRRWSVFAGSFLAARSGSMLLDAPAIVLMRPPGGPPLDPRITALRFEGEIGRDDACLVFAEARGRRPRSRLEAILAVELAVELAGWDLDLVRELAGLSLEQLMDPIAWADGRYANVPTSSAWAEGTLDRFEDRSFPSFATLMASGDHDAIRARVWRAEVRGLFPWLEDVRQAALDKFAGKFRLPVRGFDDGMISNPAELDWGQIQWALRSQIGRAEMDLVSAMKRIRNRLAHREPVPYAELIDAGRLVSQHLDPAL